MDPIKSIAVPAARKRRADETAGPPSKMVAGGVAAVPPGRRPDAAARAQPAHRFRLGEHLQMNGGARAWKRDAARCVVIALLPFEGGQLLYRVRSDVEHFERVVAEIDLAPLATAS